MFLSMANKISKNNETDDENNEIDDKIRKPTITDNSDITKIKYMDILSFINPSLAFTLKNVTTVGKYANPLNVVNGILNTLSISKNSALQIIDEKGISQVKLSDILSSTLFPIVSSINGFLSTFGMIGVSQKHIRGFIYNLLKVVGLNNETIEKMMSSLGFEKERAKKITSVLEKLNPVVDMIKIGYEFTIDKLRGIVSWIREKVDDLYRSMFDLSPKEIFQSLMLPLLPPFVSDIAGRIANYFKEVFLAGAKFLSRFVDKFFITPAKSFFAFIKGRIFKKKEEPTLLEKLIPKSLYQTVKYAEELAQALGIRIDPLEKIGMLASFAVGAGKISTIMTDKEKINKKTFFSRTKERMVSFKESVKKEVIKEIQLKEKAKETMKNTIAKSDTSMFKSVNNRFSSLRSSIHKLHQYFEEKTNLLSNLVSKLSSSTLSLQSYTEKISQNFATALNGLKASVQIRPEYQVVQNAINKVASLVHNTSTKIAERFKKIKETSSKVDGKSEEKEVSTHQEPKMFPQRIIGFVREKVLGKDNVCTKTLSRLKSFTGFLLKGAIKIFSTALVPFMPMLRWLSKFSLIAGLKEIFSKKGLDMLIPSLAALFSFKMFDRVVFDCALSETISNYVKKFFSGIWDFIVSIFSKVGEAVQAILEFTGITAIWDRIVEFMQNAWTKIKEWFTSSEILTSVFDGMKNMLKTFVEKVKSVLSSIGSLISTIYDKIKSGISTVIEGIGNIASGTGGFAKDILNRAISAVFNKTNPDLQASTIVKSQGENAVKTSIDAIVKASSMTAIPVDVLLGMGYIESRYNYNAKSMFSTAKGLFQFTDGTWKTLVPQLKRAGFSDNPLDPYSNALAAALYVGKNIKYINEFPPLVYVNHFLPNLVPVLSNALRTGQVKQEMGPILDQVLGSRFKTADVIAGNLGLFPNFRSTTVEEFLLNISQKFYEGVKVGKSLLQKLGYADLASSITDPNIQSSSPIAQASVQQQTVQPYTSYNFNEMTSVADFRREDIQSAPPQNVARKTDLPIKNIMQVMGINNMGPYVETAKRYIENNISWQLLDVAYKKA